MSNLIERLRAHLGRAIDNEEEAANELASLTLERNEAVKEKEYLLQQKSFALGNVALSHDEGCECFCCENLRMRQEIRALRAKVDRRTYVMVAALEGRWNLLAPQARDEFEAALAEEDR